MTVVRRVLGVGVSHYRPTPPTSRVLDETHLEHTYYRVSIDESTDASKPPVEHFNVRVLGHSLDWTLPVLRWKHGPVTMDLFDWHVPSEVNERIERANTE